MNILRGGRGRVLLGNCCFLLVCGFVWGSALVVLFKKHFNFLRGRGGGEAGEREKKTYRWEGTMPLFIFSSFQISAGYLIQRDFGRKHTEFNVVQVTVTDIMSDHQMIVAGLIFN